MSSQRQPPAGYAAPFYVVDLAYLQAKYVLFREAFCKSFDRVEVALSYKTATLPRMLQALHRQGALAEVVSTLEFDLAVALGVPAQNIVYNGPAKGPDAVVRALEAGVRLNLDDLDEVDDVCQYAQRTDSEIEVGLRVSTRLPDAPDRFSRFGIPIEGGQLAEAAQRLRAAGVRIADLHAHITTRRRRLDDFVQMAERLADAVDVVGRSELRRLDVGGGFGWLPSNMRHMTMPSFDEYAEAIHEVLTRRLGSLDDLGLVLEPGIALFGDVVEAWAPVVARKSVGGRQTIVVDASVHTIKPTRHEINMPTRHLTSEGREKTGPRHPVDVVGFTCLEDDFIARDLELCDVERGDILVFENVGAYTWVFKPPFIRPLPAFLGWDGTQWLELRPAQRLEEIYPELSDGV